MPFLPKFTITAKIANDLMRIEAAKQAVVDLPITPSVLATLRETARLFSTHYSTLIEGNRLTQEQVFKVIEDKKHFPGRARDEKEVLGYYAALEELEQITFSQCSVTETHIQMLHALVVVGGRKKIKLTSYRDGQNVIRDGRSLRIVYMPPEAKDVPLLMKEMLAWLTLTERKGLPCPIRASIAHYQFATIHPYYDGNGCTARLLTTLILRLGGYDLKGLYSLEEYYALNLGAYYKALTIGPSHNYYEGRVKANITKWVEYFCEGMANSFERVKHRAQEAAGYGMQDCSVALRRLDPRQRKALELFRDSNVITSRMLKELFGISQRAACNLLAAWVRDNFIVIFDQAKKSRKYKLAKEFRKIIR